MKTLDIYVQSLQDIEENGGLHISDPNLDNRTQYCMPVDAYINFEN